MIKQKGAGQGKEPIAWRQELSVQARSSRASRPHNTEQILFLPLPHPHVETDYTILVPQPHDGNATRDVVLHLDKLLRRAGDVGGVGERQIIFHLLLNGDCRTRLGGRGLGGKALRIDLDAADAKQFLHPVADGRVQCGAEDGIRGL